VKGGDASFNAHELERLLEGGGNSAYRDIVLLNSAAALTVAGKAESLDEGARQARETLRNGSARAKLELLRTVTQRLAA
jgi:anthranilate phosphoribosyltransferase